MRYRIIISFFAVTLFALIITTGGPGCANIIPPEGGFRDTLGPVLLKANPRDSTLNFQGNKITLTFDEFVQLDNFMQNVLVSPIPRSVPNANYKLNTVTIRLRDSLEANTTYSIDFGNAIKDVNEGNIMKGFRYVFSTGPSIDSLSFGGNVLLAESGKADSTLIVILHKSSQDSAILKEKPRYMAKLNGKGGFLFSNLPADTFYVYAMKDDSRTYRYDAKKLFAFADSPIVAQNNTPQKTLYAYVTAKATETTSATSSGTTGQRNAADKRLKFQTTTTASKQDLLKKFSFTFERPLRQFDSSKVRFATDTVFTPIRNYSWSLDSTKKKLALNYTWSENTLYHLILEKEFATDTLGQQMLRPDTITFITMKNSDYGKLAIRFRNLDMAKNPVLQFVQSETVTASFPLNAVTFSQELFPPGEYDLRILQDANKNGVWDPGEFFGRHRQPELVTPVQRKISVKPNWENEFEIAL
ncbi:MAG: Ig-like domain-containing protein [Chitinophagaceae bacterium]|nr:Ig-like domain-containing protein [Chitinophagaceae bacterium]